MRSAFIRLAFPGCLFLFGLFAFGCQTENHHRAQPKVGQRVGCQSCYNEMTAVAESVPYDFKPSSAFAYRDRLIEQHQCPDCRTEMSIYIEDGVRKIKCAKCAPEGLACDKCLPPVGFAK